MRSIPRTIRHPTGRDGRTKREAPADEPAGVFLLEAVVSAVAMPMMVMMVVVTPAMVTRTPSVMAMTAPAVPPVTAPAMAVMSTPAMVSAMVVVVTAPAILDWDNARLRWLGQGNGRSKRCRLNDTRRDADDAEGECCGCEPTPCPLCECAKRHVSLRRL